MKLSLLKNNIVTKKVYSFLQIAILILSLFLVISISIDIFNNISFETEKTYLRIQLWICIFFLFNFFFDLLLSDNKWRYIATHFLFFIISIPYLNIIDYYHIHLSNEVKYFIRFIPLIRGGYALAIIVGRFTKSKAAGLFISYLTMMLATVYFSSLLFFAIEPDVNPAVKSYSDSLWWAFMNVTTVGSDIYAVTVAGRILSVVLAAIGMMMFPIFTVYITSVVQKVNNNTKENQE